VNVIQDTPDPTDPTRLMNFFAGATDVVE
jgi:hypothetical protein